MESKKIFDSPIITRLLIVILAFFIVIISVSSIRIDQMGVGDFFVFSILPLPYWIGIAIIGSTAFFGLKLVNDKRSRTIFIFISLILIVSFRLAFPVMFTSIPAYEPDAINYMTVVNSWIKTGIDFSSAGHYEHDYPIAYLIAFTFIKFGVPIDAFFRAAPFAIYAIDLLILFLIIREVTPDKKKIAAASIFLFSFSSLGYWITVHYCPDLVGSLFFFVSLYLGVRFAKKGEWSIKSLAPVLTSIVILILSHHLSTLYFTLTMLGFAFATWFFRPLQIKGKSLSFFILGIFTYTFWFLYGGLLYPNFFNIYSYFGGGGYGSPTGLLQQAGFINNFSFVIYPIFIAGLFIFEILKIFQLKVPSDLFNIRMKIRELRIKESQNLPLVFSVGFIFILGLFFVGFALPVSFPERVLEVLCIGLFPLSSQAFLRISEGPLSKKKLLIIIVILLFVILTGVFRYYSQIQRRVIITY